MNDNDKAALEIAHRALEATLNLQYDVKVLRDEVKEYVEIVGNHRKHLNENHSWSAEKILYALNLVQKLESKMEGFSAPSKQSEECPSWYCWALWALGALVAVGFALK